MSEIKITVTAPEITEAIHHLAIALERVAGVPIGEPTPATPNVATPTVAAPTTPTPTAPTSAPQYAPAVPTTPSANYPTEATQPVNVAPVAPTAAPPIVPTAAPTFTLEMLSKAGADLVDMGLMDSLMMLLNRFGVEAITSLNPEHYGAFATELRNLGAQI